MWERIEVWKVGVGMVFFMGLVVGLAYLVGGIVTGLVILVANGLFNLGWPENAMMDIGPVLFCILFAPSLLVEIAFPAMAKLVDDAKAKRNIAD